MCAPVQDTALSQGNFTLVCSRSQTTSSWWLIIKYHIMLNNLPPPPLHYNVSPLLLVSTSCSRFKLSRIKVKGKALCNKDCWPCQLIMESRSHFAKFLTTHILLFFDFSIVSLGSLIQNTFICSIFVNNIYDTTSIILSSLSWTKDEILKTL